MVVLDTRLKAIAEMVGTTDTIADIGTDHGLLVTWLALQNRIQTGYACDRNPLPLRRAKNLIKRHHLEDRVSTILTDGLKGLEGKEIDTFVIAGMGGELIGRILEESPWSFDSKYTFLLQPMSRDYFLREFLYRQGFVLEAEQGVTQGKHSYTCMKARYIGEPQNPSLHFTWSGLLWEDHQQDAVKYLQRKYQQLQCMQPSFVEGDGYREMLAQWKERFDHDTEN